MHFQIARRAGVRAAALVVTLACGVTLTPTPAHAADSNIGRMRQGFEQAIAQASEITQLRQEAGTALAAANSRINTRAAKTGYDYSCLLRRNAFSHRFCGLTIRQEAGTALAAANSRVKVKQRKPARMRQGFEQAIAQASEITQLRQEAGTALAAANSRINTRAAKTGYDYNCVLFRKTASHVFCGQAIRQEAGTALAAANSRRTVKAAGSLRKARTSSPIARVSGGYCRQSPERFDCLFNYPTGTPARLTGKQSGRRGLLARQGFEQAIAQASEITQLRQEAGTALAAANSRLNN